MDALLVPLFGCLAALAQYGGCQCSCCTPKLSEEERRRQIESLDQRNEEAYKNIAAKRQAQAQEREAQSNPLVSRPPEATPGMSSVGGAAAASG